MLLGDAAAGGSADLRRLELLAAGDAAADVVDQVAQRRADGHLDQAGVLDRSGQGEDLGALAAFGALGGEPGAAVEDDGRHVGVGLDVVQHRGLAPQTLHGGERRPRAGLAAVALDRGQQGRLLAADEGPGAHADLDVEVEASSRGCPGRAGRVRGLGPGRFSAAGRPADTPPGRRCSPARRRRCGRRRPCLRCTLCGSPSRMLRSMNAPGSPSSALQTTNFLSPAASRVNFHFRQVGNPAPPRPRSPEVRMVSITCSGRCASIVRARA